MPCTCPVCEAIGEQVTILNKDGSAPGALISLHNLYQYIPYIEILDRLKDNREAYLDCIRRTTSEDCFKACQFIDYVVENGFEKARIKFVEDLKLKTKHTKTMGVLDF